MTDAETIKLLTEQNEFQKKIIESLNENIASLTAEIAELKEKLNKNSSNSSKPPSSDGYSKPKPKSLRKKSGRKPGGQFGHKGSSLSAGLKADKTEIHYHPECLCCPHFEVCKGTVCFPRETRTVVDFRIVREVTNHVSMRMNACPLHGGMRSGEFPQGVDSRIQYGNETRTCCTFLSSQGLAARKTASFIASITGFKMSEGTVINMLESCANKVSGVVDKIKEALIASPVNHYDETGVRVAGRLGWAHSASNGKYTYLTLGEKRGEEGIKGNGVIALQNGVAVHDCWAPYWKFTNITHALCCAHLLRELLGIIENYPEQEWAKKMQEGLLALYKLVCGYRDKGIPVPRELLLEHEKNYDGIIALARSENPPPPQVEKKRGRKKKGKVLCLIERLEKHKDSVLLFARNPSVPFTNNIAEQSVRNLKVKVKVAGCFRSKDGAKWYLKIRSYIDSARKHGIDAYEAVRLAFAGTPQLCFGC